MTIVTKKELQNKLETKTIPRLTTAGKNRWTVVQTSTDR